MVGPCEQVVQGAATTRVGLQSEVQTELGTYHLSYSEHCACPKA